MYSATFDQRFAAVANVLSEGEGANTMKKVLLAQPARRYCTASSRRNR